MLFKDYYKILELEKLIRNMISWFSVEKCYGNNMMLGSKHRVFYG